MAEGVKEAFQKVKQDIFSLGDEISRLRAEMNELKTEIKLVSQITEETKLKNLEEPNSTKTSESNIRELVENFRELSMQVSSLREEISQISRQIPAHQHENQAQIGIPTDIPTLPKEIRGSLESNGSVSIGNGGVPTDRPTNQQTDQHVIQHINTDDKKQSASQLDRASEILATLDNLKKEVRLKFKRLTSQEMQVFSLLYSLEESGELVDYKLLAGRLSLSESSIRDYIGKIQKKGIPISKEKLNNKRVILHISPDLRKIASLNTILKLREL
jgi:chromosome segregation ATPase